jgi:hypothetical protein
MPEDSPCGDAWGGSHGPGEIFGRFLFAEVGTMGDFYVEFCQKADSMEKVLDEMKGDLDEIWLHLERLGLVGNGARSPKPARPKPKLKVIHGSLQSRPTERQEVQP